MTLLMRWSGLRIRDAVTLERNKLHGDSLMLYQAKTGTPVYVPLPPQVVEAPRQADIPSLTRIGTATSAAAASNHAIWKSAFTPSATSAISAR
jgi:integrase